MASVVGCSESGSGEDDGGHLADLGADVEPDQAAGWPDLDAAPDQAAADLRELDSVDAQLVADVVEEDLHQPPTGPCEGPVNVVEDGFSADLKIDLTNYQKGNYAIDQHVRLTPPQAGSSVSLFGVGFLLGKVSVPYRYENDVLTVCPGSFQAGETVEFDIRFLVRKSSQYLGVFGLVKWEDPSGVFIVGPSNEPHHAARWWFVPEATFEVDPSLDDSKTVTGLTMEVTAPDASWTVVGPGGLGSQEDAVWRFSLPQTAPLYAIAFAASPDYELFHVATSASGVDIWGTAFPQNRALNEDAYLMAEATVDYMEAEFGPYVFTGESGRNLSLVEVPKYGGAMENVGNIWMGTDAMESLIVAHETVHHWVGNAFRFADWPDFWLAEGFTEYITMFNFAAQYLPPSDIDWYKNEYRFASVQIGSAFPGALSFDSSENMDDHFISNMTYYYVYGATILEMIDQRLLRAGADGFWPLLTQRWYCDACDEVTTADFEQFLQQEAGDLGIDWQLFFDEWVYTYDPPPMLRVSNYQLTGVESPYQVSFNLERIGGNPVPLKGLEVVLMTDAGPVTVAVDLAAGPGSAQVAALVDSAPTLIAVDPDILYVSGLETEEGWTGPSVSNSRYGYQF